jgi:hypothetical protein
MQQLFAGFRLVFSRFLLSPKTFPILTIYFLFVLYFLKHLRNIIAYKQLVRNTKLDFHARHDNTQASCEVH